MNKTIYDFEVWKKLEQGKTVYLVDMNMNTIQKVNEMNVMDCIKMLNEDTSRYIFYTDVEEGKE